MSSLGMARAVLDFDYRDWTRYNGKNPIKTQEAARFKFSKS